MDALNVLDNKMQQIYTISGKAVIFFGIKRFFVCFLMGWIIYLAWQGPYTLKLPILEFLDSKMVFKQINSFLLCAALHIHRWYKQYWPLVPKMLSIFIISAMGDIKKQHQKNVNSLFATVALYIVCPMHLVELTYPCVPRKK